MTRLTARSILLALAFTLFALTLALPARAGSDEADAAFARGRRAFDRGDAGEAAAAFDEADRLFPHGVAKYSAALAWESEGDLPRAADRFALALASRQLSAKQEADAEKRLTRLRHKIGRIEISAPDGSSIDVAQLTNAKPPVIVHVSPGTHEIKVRFSDGRTARKSVQVSAGSEQKVEVEAPEPTRLRPERTQPEPARPAPARPAPARPKPAPSSAPGSTQRTIGWIAIGAGGAAAGVAAYLGLRALSARNEFFDSNLHNTDAHDRAANLRTATNVTWGIAGVLAATGVTLLLTAPKANEEISGSASLRVVVNAGGAAVLGAF